MQGKELLAIPSPPTLCLEVGISLLHFDEDGKVLGYIGESVEIFDCYGTLLHVGDVVCITGTYETFLSFVHSKEDMTNFLDIDGTPPMYEKMIAYKLISHNDVVNGVRAVLEGENS